jgi:hypothetical protein
MLGRYPTSGRQLNEPWPRLSHYVSHGQLAIASTPNTTRQSRPTLRGWLAANVALLAANARMGSLFR